MDKIKELAKNKKVWLIVAVVVIAVLWNHFQPLAGV